MAATRRFVVIGRTALASPDFLLQDLPSTSGRLDVLVRCVRSALLLSHGVRRDTSLYLVLLGGPSAPRSLRFDGATAEFLRPDERSLAVLAQKALSVPTSGEGFVRVRAGIAAAAGGLDAVLADLGAMTPYVLDEHAPDVRGAPIDAPDAAFFFGDHLGLDDAARGALAAIGARPVGLGPRSLHAEDAITVLANELDRREPAPPRTALL